MEERILRANKKAHLEKQTENMERENRRHQSRKFYKEVTMRRTEKYKYKTMKQED